MVKREKEAEIGSPNLIIIDANPPPALPPETSAFSASSERWLGRWRQKSEKENCPIGMISVIATADMNPTKPSSTASAGDLLRKERGPDPGEETSGPSKRSRAGTSEAQLIEAFRSVLPLDGS